MKYSTLWRISSSYFVAGVGFNESHIVDWCAPIIKYMRGWNKQKVYNYCKKKNWNLEKIR